ncbi:hypothetical protein H4R34_005282 [Dimargaris verticillata]|uniref:Inositol polyphosphate-related phosphatase domain-containing protein n=1 Tax=Dimargaris verticillata TaxID=2761393 RepID=A0A9W8E6C3_9FUNG|nr:hypothetical protein H4R34_005282 [Dimargaris verticillata]
MATTIRRNGIAIFAGTYNVESRLPYQPFDEWLLGSTLATRTQPSTTNSANSLQSKADMPTPGTANATIHLPHVFCVAFQEFGPRNTALLDANNGLIRSCTTMIENTLDQLDELARASPIPLDSPDISVPATALGHFSGTRLDLPINRFAPDNSNPAPPRYSLRLRHHYAGMLLFIYALDSLVALDAVQINQVGCGPAYVGLKGAIGVSMTVRLASPPLVTKVCAVAAHLTAHEHLARQRNYNYLAIIKRLVFQRDHRSAAATAKHTSTPNILDLSTLALQWHFDPGEHMTVFDHDYVLFMGDLNYRITKNLGRNLAVPLDPDDQELLLRHDELSRERALNHSFQGFGEAPITFSPTYKFTTGCNVYVFRKRNPSWCDRILYWSRRECRAAARSPTPHSQSSISTLTTSSSSPTLPPNGLPHGVVPDIVPLRYSGHFEYLCSDHRPVSGLYKLYPRASVPSSTNSFLSTLLPSNEPWGDNAAMDPQESDYLPHVTMDPWWQYKQRLGWAVDHAVGRCWCLSLYLVVSPFYLALVVCSVAILVMLVAMVAPTGIALPLT